MFCNQCGEEVPEDSKFCPFCGASTVRPRKNPKPEPTDARNEFRGQEVKKNPSDIGNNAKSFGKNPNIRGKDAKNPPSPKSERKRKICLLLISTAIVAPFLFLWVHAQNKEQESLKQGVQQIESQHYYEATVTLIGIDSKKGKDLYNLASAFENFNKGDYEMAEHYLKDVSINTLENDYPDLKDSIVAMKTKLDDTKAAREKAQKEKFEAEEKQRNEKEQQRAQEYQNTLHIGDPDNKIVDVMGTPEAKNTTQIAGHQSVQWVYKNVYIYTDDGIITSFQKFE